MSLNVVIIGDQFGFPEGTASTNYMHLLAKGMKHAGASVHVMPLYSDPIAASRGLETKGETKEGISWEFASGTVSKPDSKLARLWVKLTADMNVARRLCALHKDGRMDVLLYNGWSFDLLLEYSAICSGLKCPFVVQLLEWPAALPRASAIYRLNNRLFCKKVFNVADATVVISSYLQSLARDANDRMENKKLSLCVPILLDPARMDDVVSLPRPRPFVLYCANMDTYYEDAIFVMEAFAASGLDTVDLLMVGKASDVTLRNMHNRASAFRIARRLIIRNEYLKPEELFGLYKGAEALLAPLHSDVRSVARFPFKLGEYLLSCRPVVSCAIGEVGLYLKDGETAYLSADGSTASFARKLQEAVTSNRSRLVAENGRNLALKKFDNVVHGQHVVSFLATLAQNHNGRLEMSS